MLIDNLNIHCFRGISESLSLDFTAPLTVLYAPNGTGKTSICDAVEWVLCGGVGRLGQETDIRCKLGNHRLKTIVEANIPQNGSPFFIKRELSDSGTPLFWKDSNCDYTVATDQELLRRFVKGLPPRGNSNKAKVDWVRSTRFLESDSLRLLIDSDKESNDTRKLIFSSLFGVAEYQKNERDLNRILGKLPSVRKIKSETKKIDIKISEYEELLKKLASEQTAPYRDHAHNLLNTIAERLSLTKKKDENIELQEYHKALEVGYIQQFEALIEKKSVLASIREKHELFQGRLFSYNKLNKTIKADVASQAKVVDNYNNKKAQLIDEQETSKRRELRIHEIFEVIKSIVADKVTWVHLHNAYKQLSLKVDASTSRTSKISNYIALEEQKIEKLKEKLLFVDDQLKSFLSWRTKSEELRGLDFELEALQKRKFTENPNLPLAEQASKIKSELYAMQSSREKVLGEIELLLSSGKKYVETHTGVSDCPLCEYEYESNSVLKEKINTRFSKLSSQSKEEAMLASKLDEIMQLLTQENNHFKKIEELTTKKNILRDAIQKTSDALITLGLNLSDISKPEAILEKLENIYLEQQNLVKKLSRDLEPYRNAYDAATKLEEMRIKTQSLRSLWMERLDMVSVTTLTIDDIGEALESLKNILEQKGVELKQVHEDLKSNIQKLSNEILTLEDANKKASAEIIAAKEKFNLIQNFLQDFKREWAVISDAEIINSSGIEEASADIFKKEQLLNEVKGLFSKTEDYFVKIRETEKKEQEHGLYKKEIKEAQDELKEWNYQAKTRSVVEKEIDLIKEEVRRFISEEIRPLSNIINTLYLRAQGNRFINSIEARPSKNGFLEWIAELNEEGQSFEEMRSLSQGQRQDLALSIFLARARSLGGTFFLDEPLAHLDDLNRVALLDTLRIIVSESRATNPLRLVLTTASNNLLRHLREKFSLVEDRNGNPALRIYKMSGNPKIGLDIQLNELVSSPNKLLINDSVRS